MKQGPASTMSGQSDARQVLRPSGGCPRRCVVARCHVADEQQLGDSVFFLKLRQPLFEADWRRQ